METHTSYEGELSRDWAAPSKTTAVDHRTVYTSYSTDPDRQVLLAILHELRRIVARLDEVLTRS